MSGSHEGFLDLDDACVLLKKFRCCRYGHSPLWKKHFSLVLFRLRTYDEKCRFIECCLSLLEEQDWWLRMQLNGLWSEYAKFPPDRAATYNEAQFRDWRDNALMFMNWLVRFDLTLLASRMSWTDIPLSSQALAHRAREHHDWMDVLTFWTHMLFPPSDWCSDVSSSNSDVPTITIVCSPCLESTQTPSRQEEIPGAKCASTVPYSTFSPARSTHLLEASPVANLVPPSDFGSEGPVPPSPLRNHWMNAKAEFPAPDPVGGSTIPARIVVHTASSDNATIRISKRTLAASELHSYGFPSTKRAKH